MTVHFIVSEHSRLQQPAPLTTPPLSNSRPIGALLHPLSFYRHSHPARSATPPFGTAETRRCPPLKQENSLIFGPWLPIHVFFIQKLHNVTLDHQNTIQLINFSVWTPFKMWSDSLLGWSITTKKLNTTRDLKYKGLQKQEMSIIIENNEKSKLDSFVPLQT